MAGHGLGGADQEFVALRLFAEDVFDGLGLEGVADGGGGGVGVDVVDLVGGDAGDAEGGVHGATAAIAFGSHAGHVVGVAAHAAGLGELELLENEDAGAFAADEAVAILVKGAAGVGGVVVAGGEGLHGSEAADRERRDGSLGATGDHGVGVAALDDAEGVADGVRGTGAGGGGGLVGTLGAVLDGDVAGGEVNDGRGDEEGRDLARAAVEHVGVLALDDVETADAGTDVDADGLGVLWRDLEAGVLHGLLCGGHGEVDEAAHLAGLLLLHEGVHVEVLDFGGDTDRVTGEIESGDLSHATLSDEQALPYLRCGVAHPAEEPHARYNDSTMLHCLLALLVLLDVLGRVLDGLDFLRILVGDLDIEGLLELHHELDDVERVGTEIFLEACAGSDFGFIHLKLLDNNLLNLLINCCHRTISYEVLGWARTRGSGQSYPIDCPSVKAYRRDWTV